MTDAYALDPGALCIAGPSSGKTWLQKHVPNCQDTDDVWNNAGFFKNWHEMSNEREIPLAWIIRFLNHGSQTPWLTNIWGEDYLNVLLEKKRNGLILVFRDNPKLIRDIMHSRAGMTPELKKRYDLKRISSWVSAWEKYANRVTKNVIVLKDDQFLSDVVKWDGRSWKQIKPSILPLTRKGDKGLGGTND